mgnify:CR=1 FL=1
MSGLLRLPETGASLIVTVLITILLPPTEVVTHNEFFDYDAKYNGQVDEITPARISDELTRPGADVDFGYL